MKDDSVGGDWGWVIIPEVFIALIGVVWSLLMVALHIVWVILVYAYRGARWLWHKLDQR